MPVRRALESSGKFLREATPQARENPPKTTPRDIGTMGISTSIVVIAVWLIHDVVKAPIPLEVAAGIANIGGFFLARKFRY